jgi:dihydroceramidase
MDIKHIHIPTPRTIHDGILEAPFWGWPTATIDWCEESKSSASSLFISFHCVLIKLLDYTISPYIAEFVNTMTNAFFSIRALLHLANSRVVSLACFGVRNSIRERYHPWFIATELGFMLVGIGSWLFHATLLYQVSDPSIPLVANLL